MPEWFRHRGHLTNMGSLALQPTKEKMNDRTIHKSSKDLPPKRRCWGCHSSRGSLVKRSSLLPELGSDDFKAISFPRLPDAIGAFRIGILGFLKARLLPAG
ncbi:MAG: hypothetical protein QNJ03_04950 [Dinoroseobacter sp.]|nr:hypothetical protein [Dinoroseobacter sp.]